MADTSATEESSANAAGYYLFDLAQAETNGNKLQFTAKSSTGNVVCICVPAVDYPVSAAVLAFFVEASTSDVVSGVVEMAAAAFGGTRPYSYEWSVVSKPDASTVNAESLTQPLTGFGYALSVDVSIDTASAGHGVLHQTYTWDGEHQYEGDLESYFDFIGFAIPGSNEWELLIHADEDNFLSQNYQYDPDAETFSFIEVADSGGDGNLWDGTSFKISNLNSMPVATVTLDAPGSYTFRVTVTDADSNTVSVLVPVSDGPVTLPSAPPSGYGGGAGAGLYPINQDGGTGLSGADISIYLPYTSGSPVGSSTGVLKFTGNGTTAVAGLSIDAYLASDFDSNIRAANPPSTKTHTDGRWLAPLMLDSGTWYLLVGAVNDGFDTYQAKIVVP